MTRTLVVALFSLPTLFVGAAIAADAPAGGASQRIYIGTYTQRGSEGIYQAQLNAATGAIDGLALAAKMENPSFLALHPKLPVLYAIGEVGNFEGKPGGVIAAYAIAPADGKLTLLNRQSTVGSGPCHVNVDATGHVALAANYGSGSVASYSIDAGGKLSEAKSFVQHKGSSVNKGRQEGPHAHGIYADPSNRFVLVPDLGLDKVMVYRLDAEKATLTANDPPFAETFPGAGPRHLAFHPDGKHVFVINELNCMLTLFNFDAATGTLDSQQTLATLPSRGRRPTYSTAEVMVHPSGKFVYGSNRGHDSIAAWSFDAAANKLRLVGHQSTGGKTPRSFAINPTGRWLLAANQDSGSIVVLAIDPQTGKLSPTSHKLKVPMPVCIVFAK